MIELPDDELDKLFRKSSEELDPTYEPDDWNDLRKRLDQQDGKTPAGWWRKWWPLGVLALLIPAGIALYSWYAGKKEVSGLKTEALVGERRMEEGGREKGVAEEGVKESNGGKEEAGKENGGRDNGGRDNGGNENGRLGGEREKGRVSGGEVRGKSGALNADSGPAPVSRGKNAVEKPETNIKETGKSFSKSDASAAGNAGSRLLPRSQSKTGGVYLEPNRSKVGGGDGAFSLKNNTNAQGSETPQATGQPNASSELTTTPDEPTRTLVSASALNGRGLKWNALVLPGISEPLYELPEPPAPPKRSALSAEEQPLWAVRFGYSPDLSTVGLKDFSKPGTSVSLLVEYSVLPRVYLQSGAVWSRKDYYATADAYELPKTPHVYLSQMTGIDGVCKVLEVPVNLRFDIALKQRSRLFAGAGFSSYHMNSEKYKYNYVNPNDPNAVKYPGWNGKTGWYWLSHANVSAGYEYRFSRKLSLMAEPSVRMPLKRVGYGKVNLITTGLWLSVRYTPVFK